MPTAPAGPTVQAAPAARALRYRLFEGVDASHRLLVRIGARAPAAVAPGETLSLAPIEAAPSFARVVGDGVDHILSGLDHVLFLVTLLLPAVMRRRDGAWTVRDRLGPALLEVIWLATAFTAAHSLTLAAATLGGVRVPARIIEPLIAATVLLAALNNLVPMITRRLALVAFAFGLVHGFGFAEALAPLQLPTGQMMVALAGFNVGVELGQLIIVGVAFGLLAVLSRWRGYGRWVLSGGSAAVALVALGWIVNRVMDQPVFPLLPG